MNIYITGAEGSVGKELIKLGCRPLDVDVTNLTDLSYVIENVHPDIIINLACKSDPDFCENKENEKIVIQTNVRGAYNVADAAERLNIPVVFLSTDHIFDGKSGPYKEGGKLGAPVNFYGQTKLAMEAMGREFDNVKIVRTSTLFHGRKPYQSADYPTFLSRSFMYLPHFAKSLYEYALRFSEMPKILHISGSQTISWYEFALATATVLGIDKETIIPRRKELKNYDGAPRPHKGGLNVSLSKKLGLPQHDFLDGLKQMHEDELTRQLGYQ